MSLRARAALLALLALTVTVGSTVTVVAETSGPSARSVSGPVMAPTDPETVPGDPETVPDSVATVPDGAATVLDRTGTTTETLRVELAPDGDAKWTVTANFSIETENETAAFEEVATAFENGETSALALEAFRRASRAASTTTGRPMTIRRVNRTVRTYNGTGQLVLEFTWTNFSRRTDSTIHVDDVFNTTDGTWLEELGPGQRLIIEPPTGYTIINASPSGYRVTSGSLRWTGPLRFEPGDLSATYRRVTESTTPSPATNTTTSPNGTEPPREGDPLLWIGLLLVGVGIVAVGAYVFSRDDEPGSPAATETEGDGGDGAGASGQAEPATEPEPAADPEPAAGATGDPEVDEELLSDEERIERLLEQNGGRMKQANIVKETGWSNAKVSQLLSSMDDEDRIDKLRIGRENLISFPDEDVTDIDDS